MSDSKPQRIERGDVGLFMQITASQRAKLKSAANALGLSVREYVLHRCEGTPGVPPVNPKHR